MLCERRHRIDACYTDFAKVVVHKSRHALHVQQQTENAFFCGGQRAPSPAPPPPPPPAMLKNVGLCWPTLPALSCFAFSRLALAETPTCRKAPMASRPSPNTS